MKCRDCVNVYDDMPCGGAALTAFELLTMHTPRNAISDATEVTSGADRFVTLAGLRFQAEHLSDPSEWLGFPSCDPAVNDLAFLLTIWEAIVVLPFAQGTQIPAYIPDLTSPINQTGDIADRVLWKRITYLPMWGLNTSAQFPQLTATYRDAGHGPVAVKTKVRLDEKHGVYYVRNFVHDLFGLTGEFNSCIPNGVSNPCVIPVQLDFWGKLFVHAIR